MVSKDKNSNPSTDAELSASGKRKKSLGQKATKVKRSNKKRPKVIEHPRSSAIEFTNREIGWLEFNTRVLAEAKDLNNPLLERLKFLGICNSNMDEFFMKRVGGLKRQIAYGISPKSSDGKTPVQQLKEIRNYCLPMIDDQRQVFQNSLVPALKKEGIFLLNYSELTTAEKEAAEKYYYKNIFPVLTPLSVDPGHPFPFISNLSVSLGITLQAPNSEEKFFARVKVPQVFPAWIQVGASNEYRFVSLIELIQENLTELFPSMKVLAVMPFRVTRNADIERDEEDAEDLLQMIEEELRQRRFAEVVRLEHGPNPDPWMVRFLMDELDLTSEDIFEKSGILDYTGLNVISDLPIAKLKYSSFTPVLPAALMDEDFSQFFHSIRKTDQLVHHPFESFVSSVEKFVRFAADDPKVLAIKMTLYRTGDNSPFIKSLIRAAENGKQVVCLVELKARFDEERNIYWAQELENAGVHVVYGIVGLKTHAKTVLVVRQESDGLQSYVHIGTGNYNVSTSRLYTDFGLLTANEEITSEIIEFFNYLTGRSLKNDYKHLLVAPLNMFQRFKLMIEREIEHQRAGKPAQIIAKMNNMEENDISISLYGASGLGVKINMIVRGFCCLRPQVKGLSENIFVQSTIGRFLEHSRVFYFRNGAENPVDGEFYIGSADWMYRNLHARVECIVPILNRDLRTKIWDILQLYLTDQKQNWDMSSDGTYKKRTQGNVGVQDQLLSQAMAKSVGSEDASELSQ
jgi:polyphosphate kinase